MGNMRQKYLIVACALALEKAPTHPRFVGKRGRCPKLLSRLRTRRQCIAQGDRGPIYRVSRVRRSFRHFPAKSLSIPCINNEQRR